MAHREETEWQKVERSGVVSTVLDFDEGPTGSEDNTQALAGKSSTSNLGGHKDDKSTSSTSEEPGPDSRLAGLFKTVQRRRDRLIGKRVDIVNQRNEHEYQRNAVFDSNQRIVKAATTLLLRNHSFSPELQELQAALQESKERSEVLENLEEKLQQTTRGLNLKETELLQKEKRVYKRLSQITGVPRRSKQPQPTLSTSSGSTANPQPRVARRYYDRVGEVKILRERIHNMQVTQRQDLATRQTQRDSGHVPKVSDSAFKELFYTKRAALVQELELANKDAVLLKLACQRQGIELENDAESVDNRNIIDETFEDDHRILYDDDGPRSNRTRSLLLGDLLSGKMDSTTKIRRWLSTITPIPETAEPMLHGPNNIDSEEPTPPTAAHSSSQPVSPAERLDISLAIESQLDTNSLAKGHRQASSMEDFVSDGERSKVSGGPPTSSDREFAGDAPARRYSDPSPVHPFLLRPNGSRTPRTRERFTDVNSRRNSR
jgi:hypothetical protein